MAEEEEALAETNQRGADWVIWTATTFTIGWLSVALWMFTSAAPCDAVEGSVFSCLKGNERGDMLAGVFAPLAFIWLVATVIIQSTELREQRLEMQRNRAVSATQAEFIGQQEPPSDFAR